LFLDVRGFTRFSKDRLPYDVVFILNRLFGQLGAAIIGEEGWIDKYMGDGLLAVFGRDSDPETGCRQALAAARAIDLELERLNGTMAGELKEPITIGMGLHAGPLVLGAIGHAKSAAVTVIGEPVNVASRLEALTKDEKCQAIVSADLLRRAGFPLADIPLKTVTVRSIDAPISVLVVKRARDLPLPPVRQTREVASIAGV
jgi:adenylate cyclase